MASDWPTKGTEEAGELLAELEAIQAEAVAAVGGCKREREELERSGLIGSPEHESLVVAYQIELQNDEKASEQIARLQQHLNGQGSEGT